MNALLDTNILIDYLNGIDAAREEIARYPKPCISPITWMEVMVGAEPDEAPLVGQFLARFTQIAIDTEVASATVAIRREHRICLRGALIWASARHAGVLLVTRNSRDFPPDHPGVRIPYRVS